MSSQRRIQASRANGARSQGPKTPEGFARCGDSARRHGLLAKCVVLDNESKESFEDLLQQYIARFQPADGVEMAYIEDMVAAYWRMRRCWAIETQTLNDNLAKLPKGDERQRIAAAFDKAAAGPTLSLIHRYETRLHNIQQRAIRNLMKLRAESEPLDVPAEGPNPISEQPDPADAHLPIESGDTSCGADFSLRGASAPPPADVVLPGVAGLPLPEIVLDL